MESCSLQPATPKPWTGLLATVARTGLKSPNRQLQIPLLRHIPEVGPQARMRVVTAIKTATPPNESPHGNWES